DLGFQRNQPEDREGLSRARRPARGHLGHSGGWQNNEVDNISPAIHTPIQQEAQTRGLEGYGSSSSAPPMPQRFVSMEHGQQEAVQTPGGKVTEDKGESSHYPSYGRTANPNRANSDSFRLTRSRPNQLSSGFTPCRNQNISGQESSFFTIPGSFWEKTRKKGQEQNLFQPGEERVRPDDPEAVVLGKRSTQEPEVVLNHSRISSPINRNITPTQIEHNVITPESNLKSDALCLQISQYPEHTQKQFAELEASHERMKKLTASMDKIAKPIQEGHAQLSKSSEETNKRLNIVFEEQYCSKRDRDCLDQDINKFFNFYHNMKPQPQGHVMDNSYQPDDIKPDGMLMNKPRSPSQYLDGDGMSYSEKEGLKHLPAASSWPKLSGPGEYDHIELIYYIDGHFIDVPSIPDYWITARLNTALKGHASIWYTEMKEIHGQRNWPWWKSQIIQRYSNGKRTDIGKFSLHRSSSLKEKQPLRVEFKDKPRETVAEVEKKKNTCHNCGSTDHYANNCSKAKKKVYAIEKVPEEESPTEDSESDSMGDAIREQSDDDQDPREEFLVEYQEETPLEIQDLKLEAGIPQDTANKSLCKHTQVAQTFLVTPTRGMAYIHRTATKVTVCIDNVQHPQIIDSGAHCSIVARKYLDNHFPNWEEQLLPTKAKNFKSASGKMTSIGTIIKETFIPHRKGNIRLNPDFVVLDNAHIQGFLQGTDYQRMYGIDIYNSKNRHITIGTN
ncbi:hypothetical protein O181_094798, partial [Austropuccinia psidii MF-1]|nr:hypothetical protein [Austropuccinia psidii MF-1]